MMHRFKNSRFKLTALSLGICLALNATPSFAQTADKEILGDCADATHPNPMPQPIVTPPPSPAIAGTSTTLMGYTQFKGDLHSHPRGHGCKGMPAPRLAAAGVFQMAKATGLDFFAITNHDLSASSLGSIPAVPFECYGGELPVPGMTLYECMRAAQMDPVNLGLTPFWGYDRDTNEALIAEPLNTDSHFVSLVGYERTAREWNHLNIFDMSEWFWDGSNFSDGTIADVMYYLDKRILEGKNPIIQFNHPTPSHWNGFALDSVMASKSYLMEVQPDAAANEPYAGTEGFDAFKLALRKGWKLSPVSTSDAHSNYSWPNPNPGGAPGDFRGVDRRTGIVLAPGVGLSKANIYNAMRNRRTFSSSSPYLSAMYMVNGQPMGSTVSGTGPFEVSIQATYQLPAGSSAPQKYICNVELWAPNNRQIMGVYGRSMIKTWTPSLQSNFYQDTFTLPTYFPNYFFKINAKRSCADANEAWDSLITAPTWMTASPPQLTLSSGSVVKGANLTSTWTNPIYSSQVMLQLYKWDAASLTYNPYGGAVPVSNAQQQMSKVWETSTWDIGTYVVSITDPAYPAVEWFSGAAFVTAPPPPPPPPPPSSPPPCTKPCRVEN